MKYLAIDFICINVLGAALGATKCSCTVLVDHTLQRDGNIYKTHTFSSSRFVGEEDVIQSRPRQRNQAIAFGIRS